MRHLLTLFILFSAPLAAVADRASAEKKAGEADDLMKRQDFRSALDRYAAAIEEDPSLARAWMGRGYAKAKLNMVAASLEDYGKTLELEPGNLQARIRRHSSLVALDRFAEALEDMEECLKAQPGNPDFIALAGWDLVQIGRVDEGMEKMKVAAARGPAADLTHLGHVAKGEWAEVERVLRASLGAGITHFGTFHYLGIAQVEQGKLDAARETAATADRAARSKVEGYVVRAYLAGTPGPGFDADASFAELDRIETQDRSHILFTRARTLYHAGRVHEALDFLATRGRRTDAESLFWLGVCHWKLGRLAEARGLLSDAWRLNPYIATRARGMEEGLRDFLASIGRELQGEAGGDRGRLGEELATHLLTVAEIEVLVRRYRFKLAEEEYTKLLPTLTSEARRSEVSRRLIEVRGMAGALERLVTAVNAGKSKPKPRVAGIELTVTRADALAFDFQITKGSGRFPWAYLDPGVFCAAALEAGALPEEVLGLGCLAWDTGDRPLAVKLFEDAIKRKPNLKGAVYQFVAVRRGTPAPPEGFSLYRGGYVTADEKSNLSKGLVSFRGGWVTPEDREKLAKGMTQVDGKWIAGGDAELARRGYVKHEGKWMAREDVDELRSEWKNAWSQDTVHFTVRSNHAESFLRDLSAVVEAAWAELAKFHGTEPKQKSRYEVLAFRTYEDYRRYCVEHKAEEQLGAAGFARSDSDTVVGWNKTGNDQQFLQTMAHEVAHLFYFRIAPMARPPSWFSEATATYFEGFSWDGKGYRFHFLNESRLEFARRAMKAGSHIPLKDLLDGNALALINSDPRKALLFYAQCWALNYYLCQTDQRAYRDAYAKFRAAMAAGKAEPLLSFFPDAAALEKDWVRFITGL